MIDWLVQTLIEAFIKRVANQLYLNLKHFWNLYKEINGLSGQNTNYSVFIL